MVMEVLDRQSLAVGSVQLDNALGDLLLAVAHALRLLALVVRDVPWNTVPADPGVCRYPDSTWNPSPVDVCRPGDVPCVYVDHTAPSRISKSHEFAARGFCIL